MTDSPPTPSSNFTVEWACRSPSGGGYTDSAVLVRQGRVYPQRDFARFVRHIPGGQDLYRANPQPGDVVLYIYRSGSALTESVRELFGRKRRKRTWEAVDLAEQALRLPAGALWAAFWGASPADSAVPATLRLWLVQDQPSSGGFLALVWACSEEEAANLVRGGAGAAPPLPPLAVQDLGPVTGARVVYQSGPAAVPPTSPAQ